MAGSRHILALCMLCAAPCAADAAGARNGVETKHGEMTLLRDVNARHAYRPVPPGMATIADPKPNREIDRTLGNGELSDADFAALDSGNRLELPGRAGDAALERVTATAVAGSLGAATDGHRGAVSGAGINSALGAPLGAVGTATRGIGGHLEGALSRFPLGTAPGNGNGGP